MDDEFDETMRRFPDVLEGHMMEAVDKVTALALERFHYWSAGGTSSAQLRREDHPYAKRHGRPLRPVLPINIQRSRPGATPFHEAFEVKPAEPDGSGGATGSVINETPYAAALQTGTQTMFARPILDRVAEEIEEEYIAAMTQAVADTLMELFPGKVRVYYA